MVQFFGAAIFDGCCGDGHPALSKLLSLVLICFLSVTTSHAEARIKVGAQMLMETDFSELSGKHVGLITNNTAVVDGTHVADLMRSSEKVRLIALFAPEHGLRGYGEDGVTVENSVDEHLGVPVYSLYGKASRPTPESLKGIDLLLFDIQDIGARFYTFISTMGLAMQSAAEANISFVVLDRPNPLGGEYSAGPLLLKDYHSFVGEYPIPVAHGMTVGELAIMIKGERMLPGLENLDLRVIRMEGVRREMQWPETGLAWIRTSPNIPDFDTALIYPGVCLLEGTTASVGRGTREPFKLIGYPGINATKFVERLNSKNLPGVRFEPALFIPRSIPGMSSSPKYRNREVSGARIHITDSRVYRPVETGINILRVMYDMLTQKDRARFFRPEGFDHLAGSDDLRNSITGGVAPEEIISRWKAENDRFYKIRSKYLLY